MVETTVHSPTRDTPDVQRALMRRDIEELRDDVRALRVDVQNLMDLFKGAKAVVQMVKWIGGIAVALAALWTAWYHIIQGK